MEISKVLLWDYVAGATGTDSAVMGKVNPGRRWPCPMLPKQTTPRPG